LAERDGMSLSSLRGAATLATSAFDAARSSLRSMADAAAASGAPAEPVPAVAEAEPALTAVETPAPRKGARQGTVLDAYA
jgi:hypothetical protein